MKSITAAKTDPYMRIEGVFLSEFIGNTTAYAVQKTICMGNASIDYGESGGICFAKYFFCDIHLVGARIAGLI